MLNLVLYQPEIPPNTGNIIRLCANTGFKLHLIKPLAFELDDKRCQRAGLDYHEYATVKQYETLNEFIETASFSRLIACETGTNTRYTDFAFKENDAIIFGSETNGLPSTLLERIPYQVYIPMKPHSRSLNLSNSVAVIAFEAWRQLGFNF